jgi:hypothetical protein
MIISWILVFFIIRMCGAYRNCIIMNKQVFLNKYIKYGCCTGLCKSFQQVRCFNFCMHGALDKMTSLVSTIPTLAMRQYSCVRTKPVFNH